MPCVVVRSIEDFVLWGQESGPWVWPGAWQPASLGKDERGAGTGQQPEKASPENTETPRPRSHRVWCSCAYLVLLQLPREKLIELSLWVWVGKGFVCVTHPSVGQGWPQWVIKSPTRWEPTHRCPSPTHHCLRLGGPVTASCWLSGNERVCLSCMPADLNQASADKEKRGGTQWPHQTPGKTSQERRDSSPRPEPAGPASTESATGSGDGKKRGSDFRMLCNSRGYKKWGEPEKANVATGWLATDCYLWKETLADRLTQLTANREIREMAAQRERETEPARKWGRTGWETLAFI